MPLTLGSDKNSFWRRIRGDPYIQKTIGITGMSDAKAAEIIIRQREPDQELTDDSRFICIFEAPGQPATGPFNLITIQVDVLMAAGNRTFADSVAEQIIALCGPPWNVNGRPIYEVLPIGNLAAAPGFYRCGTRFSYFSNNQNTIKTI